MTSDFILDAVGGAVVQTLLVWTWRSWKHWACRLRGHRWQVFKGHDPRANVIKPFRLCMRCGRMEPTGPDRPFTVTDMVESCDRDLPGIEPTWMPPTTPGRSLTVADVVAHVMAKDRNKPRPTTLPSDGKSCPS